MRTLGLLAAAACHHSTPAVPEVPAAGSSVAATACLGDDTALSIIAGAPVRICDPNQQQCVSVALDTGAVATVAYAAPPPHTWFPHAFVQLHDGKPSLCAGTTCRALGPNARAAIEHAPRRPRTPAGDDREGPPGTTDLAAVVIATKTGVEVWSVAKDASILFKDPLSLYEATPIGTLLFTSWAPPESDVFTSAGTAVIELPPETAPIMLDERHWFAVSQYHELAFIDDNLATHTLELDSDANTSTQEQVAAASQADHSVVVALRTADAISVMVVDPATASIRKRWPIARCR